ncbi:hypothetical protein GGR56DRAFT_669483 [Xylariaceae sp. FL0804]|nr:hypothetical protein GGR56DRAFT_669483 [Xylariaceae sp. FL0804]
MADDSLKSPKQLPSSTHEVIVVLQSLHLPLDGIDTTPRTHELIAYSNVDAYDEVRERIQCASIVVAIQSHINRHTLGRAPYLAGTEHIDVDECRRRGIRVGSCPGSTSPAVAEHAIGLYFAARRKTVMLHNEMRTKGEDGLNRWKRDGTIAPMMQTANARPPCSLGEEVVGIIGYGNIGRRLEELCLALGMRVLIAERKGSASSVVTRTTGAPAAPAPAPPRPGRTPFDEVVRTATVLFLACAYHRGLRGMVGAAELGAMRPEAVVVNVARAGVLDAAAAVAALRARRISGVAVDVFDHEPASGAADSAFLAAEEDEEKGEDEDVRHLNIILSPHVGYFSTGTLLTMKAMARDRIREFVGGDFGDSAAWQ